MTEPAPVASTSGTHRCDVCGQNFPVAKLRSWISVRPGLSDLIAQTAPSWAAGKYICKPDLVRFRRRYVEKMLESERGELDSLDRQVIDSLDSGHLVTRNPIEELERTFTFGERTADKVAEFGGSWTFIISFAVVLVAWIVVSVIGLRAQPFDPYPFILLN